MIKTVNAGTPVKSGYYFNLKTWVVHPTAKDGEQLPGDADEKWVPMSLPVAVMAAPLLGAGFLMFMPALGFYLVAQAAARPITNLFHKTTTELAATMSPGLVPGEAHLTGKREDDAEMKEAGAAGQARELDAIQAEIDSKRAPKA
jgi:hypothetical protein